MQAQEVLTEMRRIMTEDLRMLEACDPATGPSFMRPLLAKYIADKKKNLAELDALEADHPRS
jgi:hypothetical protein